MKGNSVLIIPFIVSILMYLIGFFWLNLVGRILMILGGIVLAITLNVFGRRIIHSQKGIAYFCIIFSILLFVSFIFITIAWAFSKH